MNECDFWIGVWKVVAAVVSAMVLTIGGCSAYRGHLVRDAIAGGADPIKAACAINGIDGSATAAVCAVAAAPR